MKASIIIPAYKPASLLEQCLKGILSNTTMSDVEVIVVCNGSDKESAELVLGLGDPFRLVWYNEPLGFVKATNIGMKLAQGDNLVLLNTDAIILNFYEKDVWINRLLDPLKDPTVGITGLGAMYSEIGLYFPFYCAGINKKLIDEIGYLDEIFSPGYNEDADYCYKAKLKGYKLIQVDNPVLDEENPTRTITDFPIWHAGEQSFQDKQYRLEIINRNSNILYDRYLKNPMPSFTGNPIVDLSWLQDKHPEIYKEVIVENAYGLSKELMNGKNVIDIGANMGMYSILSAYYGAKKIISVEPASSTFDILTQNVKTSNFSSIECYKNAVSNLKGQKLNLNLHNDSGHNSLYDLTENGETVETITLKDILDKLDSSETVLKIDCEGAEYDILLNAEKEWFDHIKLIQMEIHAHLHPLYKGFDIIEDKILSFGYKKIKDIQMMSYIWDHLGNLVDSQPIPVKVCYFEKI